MRAHEVEYWTMSVIEKAASSYLRHSSWLTQRSSIVKMGDVDVQDVQRSRKLYSQTPALLCCSGGETQNV